MSFILCRVVKNVELITFEMKTILTLCRQCNNATCIGSIVIILQEYAIVKMDECKFTNENTNG